MRTHERRRCALAGRGGGAIAGFTLIEMVSVLVVLGIFAMLAAPSLRELVAGQRVQTTATDLQSSLLRARSEAIKQNADVTVAPLGSWNTGWVITAAGTEIYRRTAARSITISGPASVSYRSSGRIAGAAIPQFSLSDADTSLRRCVSVNLSGQPVVKKVACS